MDDIGNLGLYIMCLIMFTCMPSNNGRGNVFELLVHSIDGVVNQRDRLSLCMGVYICR